MEPSDLVSKEYSAQDFIRYYINIWRRNLVARTIDVQTDLTLKAINPEETVEHDFGRGRIAEMPVKQRLELRKLLVQEAIDLLDGASVLLAMTPEEYNAKCLSKEALAVAEDMMSKAEEPAAEVKVMPKSYKVVSENGVSLNGVEAVQAKDAVIDLDPAGEQTIALIASGAIVEVPAETAAPAAEAPTAEAQI